MRSLKSWLILATFACFAWATTAAVQAAPMSFDVKLTGAQQVPPVTTPGSGDAKLTYDPATRKLSWSVTYSGMSSPVTMAHFHGPAAAGANGPVIIWISKKGAEVSSPITGEETLTPEQAQQFMAGQWYINVHSKDHPPGEIRGQVMPPKM
ncbi:MAG TPA: CHRD domain-containing protein [Alphaproteobacteria bacterium]|nr:CHRD domain-containing protein [Alphaproteobacteria bacterium]